MSSNDVQTLANSIIGTSVLAMPYCFAKCGVILSILLLVLSTMITRTCCHFLIKASIVTRRKNMELLGFYIFGNSGKTLVELSIIGFLMGTCIAFFVVIGDLCPILIIRLFNLNNVNHDSLRFWMIIITTVVVIIPLSLQKNIHSLSFVCKASIAFYVCLTIKTVLESFSRFQSGTSWASNIVLWDTGNLLQCFSIYTTAMSCQLQLFEVFENITSFDRVRQNIFHATSICFVVYTVIGFFGYVAFYNQTLSGNILLNFTPSLANDFITLGFILSIACSFPLVIFPARTSLSSLIYRKVHHSEISPYVPESRYKPLTIFIIFSTMICGILVPSVEVVIGFVGSTIGTLICVIFPATCFVKIMQRNTTEKIVAQILIVVGFVMMILGTYSNLIALDSASSGSHLETKAPMTPKQIFLPPDITKIQNEAPPLAKDPSLMPEQQLQQKPMVVKNQTSNERKEKIDEAKHNGVSKVGKEEDAVKISDDSIKKEEQEIAAAAEKSEKQDPPVDAQREIKEKDKEIKELKASKDKLEQEVMEMKEVLVKQNQETQQLVLQKFEEIKSQVDKIEKQSLDKDTPAADDDGGGGDKKPPQPAAKEEEVMSKEKVNEPKKEISQPSAPESVVKADTSRAESKKEEAKAESKPQNSTVDHQEDRIVKLIKSQEPLSYQLGEKLQEEKAKKEANLSQAAEQLKKDDEPPKKIEIKSDTAKKGEEEEEKKPEENVSHEDFKNEMRRKRDADYLDEALGKIDHLKVQLSSLITRDLKSLNNEKEM